MCLAISDAKGFLYNPSDHLREGVEEALARRRQEGQRLGRPPGRLSTQTKLTGRDQEIRLLLQKKVAVAAIARIMGVHRTTMAHYVTSRRLRER